MITVQINSKSHNFDDEITIKELLPVLEIQKNGTAVAVNGKVVPRSLHEDHILSDGDLLEIITAVGGG